MVDSAVCRCVGELKRIRSGLVCDALRLGDFEIRIIKVSAGDSFLRTCAAREVVIRVRLMLFRERAGVGHILRAGCFERDVLHV